MNQRQAPTPLSSRPTAPLPLRRRLRRWALLVPLPILASAWFTGGSPGGTLRAQHTDRIALAVEALDRLEYVDLETHPKLKDTVYKVLEAVRGTPDYVRLVRKWKLDDQTEGLLDLAAAAPGEPAGVEALRWIFSSGNTNALQQRLASTNHTESTRLIQALGNTRDNHAVALLTPLILDPSSPFEVRRAAVRALALTPIGATALLDSAEQGDLAEDLRYAAAQELASARWPEIRAKAQAVLPLPQGRNAQPLPPLHTLLAQSGDPRRGQEIFVSESARCSGCHRVGQMGTQVGPDLTLIGAKLGKDVLYESILDPSAAISFGFEAWELVLKSGDEAFGILVSETETDVALKDTQGLITRHPTAEILDRRKMKLSIMPADLQQSMSTQDLIDLVEYLASLK